MKKTHLISFLVLLLSGCNFCKPQIETNRYIENLSNHNLKIEKYQNGNIDTSIIVDKGAKINIDSIPEFLLCDSMIVIYDYSKKKTHYFNDSLTNNHNAYLINNPRNMINISNYEKNELSEKCLSITNLTFTFTEQDYIDAQ
jgi:hypothetical protein